MPVSTVLRLFLCRHLNEQFRVLSTMTAKDKINYVRVRPLSEEQSLDISFAFPPVTSLSSDEKPKYLNFKRPLSEPLSVSLNKIAASFEKRCQTKKKKQSDSPDEGDVPRDEIRAPSPTSVALWKGESLVTSSSILNSDVWEHTHRLQVGPHFYPVVRNPPRIKSLKLNKTRVVAGCPYVPLLELENAKRDDCRFEWWRSINIPSLPENGAKKLCVDRMVTSWERVGDDFYYVPAQEDIGRLLMVRCYPLTDDDSYFVELAMPVPVTALPMKPREVFPFEKRQLSTPSPCAEGDEFRVVCYNLLADFYSDSEFSRTSLFAHCPNEWLHGDYRRQLLLREIPGYHGDVIILQEVDKKMFRNGLTAVLGVHGLSGTMATKKEVPEGLATFWRDSRFKLVESIQHEYTDLLTTDDFKDLAAAVDACPPLKEKFNVLKTIFLITVLEDACSPGRFVVVANTHLFFQPASPHVRLIQMEILLRTLRNIVPKYADRGLRVSLVLGGDFNSVPERGIAKYLTERTLSKNYNDWYACGSAEYAGLDLRHDFDLISACDEPAYTNFVAGFCGTLDYIYADASELTPSRSIPFPSHEEVTSEIALPNRLFPSDHLPLVVELRWKHCTL